MSECNFLGCVLSKADGDSFYCPSHRLAWIAQCRALGIFDRQVSELMVDNFRLVFDASGTV